MRDIRFISLLRGGKLTPSQHCEISAWACACVKHAILLTGQTENAFLKEIFDKVKNSFKIKISGREARNASKIAHSAARISSDQLITCLLRATGHAAASVHMADHAVIAAVYSLKAAGIAGKDVNLEREWQDNSIPEDIRSFIITARKTRELTLL